jgi:4-hydroxy-tetrahydrodipicolinate synthase
LQGLWLPLITPFRDGELDEASLRRLVRHGRPGRRLHSRGDVG